MRGALSLLTMLIASLAWPAAAQMADELYEGRAIVTGQVPQNRAGGFARSLEDVLVKVSGDLRLVGDPAVAALSARAALLVEQFRYRDRMSGIATHDEQGTRDRPYDLIVRFRPAAVDAALRGLGREPWRGPRPRLAACIAMRKGARSYLVAADGERDLEREAVAAAAWRRGVSFVLPPRSALASAGLSFDGVMHADLEALTAAAGAMGGDVALAGRLDWRERELVWLSEWRLRVGGEDRRWQARSETFDGGFRAGFGGAAQILSGHGAPGETR